VYPSSSSSGYDRQTLDVTAACGLQVRICEEPGARYTEITSDNYVLDGDPCPQFTDGDGDGVCPVGQDLDLDGDCSGAGEFDAAALDCDDADGAVHSGAAEACNGKDDDCDGLVDEDFDQDLDGYATCANDCDDADPYRHPGVAEDCDGVDQDCNGVVDDGFDVDQDGFTSCGGDCDDGDAGRSPGVAEVCDGVDQDCDDEVDEGVTAPCWPDRDGDGHGDQDAAPYDACELLVGMSAVGDDCDDGDAEVYPGAPDDPGDGVDGDCDGADAPADPVAGRRPRGGRVRVRGQRRLGRLAAGPRPARDDPPPVAPSVGPASVPAGAGRAGDRLPRRGAHGFGGAGLRAGRSAFFRADRREAKSAEVSRRGRAAAGATARRPGEGLPRRGAHASGGAGLVPPDPTLLDDPACWRFLRWGRPPCRPQWRPATVARDGSPATRQNVASSSTTLGRHGGWPP
jgi:hypothetical protein